jgi:putative ATP-dependent endonuclease of OLD family
MYIKELRIKNFRCFGETPEHIELDPELAVFIGDNGSGKTTVIKAMQRLFGSSSSERRLTREDVHFGIGEVPGSASGSASGAEDQNVPKIVSSREVSIEAILAFPELDAATGKEEDSGLDVVAETFYAMSCSGVGQPLEARIRLEATWKFSIDEDDIEQKIYWVTSAEDVPFGDADVAKTPMPAAQRRRIQLKYLPATRNNAAVVKSAVKELLIWLEKYGNLEAGKNELEKQRGQLQEIFDELPAVKGVVAELSKNWGQLFSGQLFSQAKLSVLSREIHKALRELTLMMSPTATGTEYSIDDLSEGQASLLYISIVASIIELNERHQGKNVDGYKEVAEPKPWLTIIALEEPENHLSPFYLSRMIGLMTSLSARESAMGILTTHSAGAVGRIEPEKIRYMRHEETTRVSSTKRIVLPEKSDKKYKYIYEAVRSNPELYFAKLVILGEGRSEEIVLPKVAKAYNSELELDPAFVAFVPLGGRHVNHLWKLLDNLQIPHVTLLDYDLGRYNAGILRLKYTTEQLAKLGHVPPDGQPADAAGWRALDHAGVMKFYDWGKSLGVHFSLSLDLDMMMSQAYPKQYLSISKVSDDGSHSASDFEKSVFGKKGDGLAAYQGCSTPSPLDLAIYDDLFKKGSKPVAHLEAMGLLTDEEIKAGCPNPLRALFIDCETRLGLQQASGDETGKVS